MLVRYNGPCFTIDFDGNSLKECFAFLGACDELFGGAGKCENCKGTDHKPKYRRTKDGFEFYSLECKNCRWEFKFGQTKEDKSLFPKGWAAPYQKDTDGIDQTDNRTSPEETARQGRDRF